jgi:hypothetical protein
MVFLALSTLSWVLVVVFAILLVVVIVLMGKAKKKGGAGAPPPVPKDLADVTIKDAMVNDIVSISGFGDEYDDVDFVIQKRNRYESNGYEWYELLGVYKGRQVWLDWEEDDLLQITATSPDQQMRLSMLNLSEDDLARMDEEESRDNFVQWDGKRFYYRESCEAFFYKDCTGPGEGFYLWDFQEEDGERFLSIEKWEGEPFAVFTGKAIKPYNVKVYKR